MNFLSASVLLELGVTAIARLAGCSDATAIRWYSVLRQVCGFKVNADHKIVGGPDLIVEIDESALCKRKYAVGRLVNARWVWEPIVLRRVLLLAWRYSARHEWSLFRLYTSESRSDL